MKPTCSLIALILFLSTTLFATDKIYKTYQDYVDGKAMIEGTIKAEEWAAFVTRGYTVKVKKASGEVEKVDVKGIWGFEQDENLDGFTHQYFLFRIVGKQIYRCLSKGKFNCWVPMEYKPMFERNAQIYGVIPEMNGQATFGNTSGNPLCFYSTTLDADLIKLDNLKQFWPLISESEKAQVEAEMKKTKLVRYPHCALQFYNKLFPQ